MRTCTQCISSYYQEICLSYCDQISSASSKYLMWVSYSKHQNWMRNDTAIALGFRSNDTLASRMSEKWFKLGTSSPPSVILPVVGT